MAVLVVAEHDNAALKAATLNTITAATALGGDVAVLVAGAGCRAVAEIVATVPGVTRVLLADDARHAHGLAGPLSALVAGLARGYGHVLAPATAFGKDLLPRVAGLLDMALISDIVAVVDSATFVRPIYAGNALVTVRSADPVRLITVRTTAFPAAFPATDGVGGTAPVETVAVPDTPAPDLSRLIGRELSVSGRPELTGARIVVSGGRGMGSAENFRLLDAVADTLGAAIGASRAAVDAGFAPNDLQVGQTGKIVAPELYIAVGISGAIQHLAGMKDAKTIVAINKDEEAPIFQIADYGLVANLFDALPALVRELDS